MATRKILFRGQTRHKGEKTSISGKPLPGIWVTGGIFPQNKGYERAIIYSEFVGEMFLHYPDGFHGGVQPFVRYRHPFQPPLFRSVRAVLQRHRMEVLSGRYRTERCHRASRTVHRHPCAVFRQMILDLCVKKGE